MLQAEHEKWSKIWGMGETPDPKPWNQEEVKVTVPAPVGWRAIQKVAKSFPWFTSNYEGLSPRHI